MRFMPHTDSDVASMLETIGAKHLDDLIAHVPANLRASATINLDPGRSESDVVHEISSLAARNTGASGFASFLGAGYYRHYVPAAVRAVIARAEFATSYTPYQAEASQGTTQAIFEFQTLITQLTAMEVANASMYDGASAAAEAVLMARRLMPKRVGRRALASAVARLSRHDSHLPERAQRNRDRRSSVRRRDRRNRCRGARSYRERSTAVHRHRLSQRVRRDRTAWRDR